MIYAYGITVQGTFHIKNDIVCQDSHKIIRCNENLVLAAVADGLGTEMYTDIASSIAVDKAIGYCKTNISESCSGNEILHIIRDSFSAALQAVNAEAESQGNDLSQYDTTLTLAVLLKETLFYGHSGDSGIVVLATDGLYEKVTSQQRDENGYVFPLCFNDRWVFAEYTKTVASVFIATDGMLETLFPFLIRNESVSIHIALAKFFMDNKMVRIDIDGEDAVQSRIEDFVKNIPDELVNDDKTVVVLINTSSNITSQPYEYYREPNWADLKRKHDEEWKRILYPHLFKDKVTERINSGGEDDKQSVSHQNSIRSEQIIDATEKNSLS